ncbi:hypothetical protein [Enterobacter cloacae]|uniref:hypothetical protein n=1 Tax=Enterobacter cloacae TaxID=550 RepID=UPI002A817C94|nr:hypothetical protein [Enterobacter cloacae]
MKEFKGSPHPWHWEGDKLCDANHMIINGGKFKFKKCDKALVTAAPDLLEALQIAENAMSAGRNITYPELYGAINKARAAISKALGEE